MTQAVLALALMQNALLRRGLVKNPAQCVPFKQCNEVGKVGACSKFGLPIDSSLPIAYFYCSPMHCDAIPCVEICPSQH